MTTRQSITLLLGGIVGSVLFGVGAIIVLTIPSLATHAMVLLPVVIVLSFILTPLISWFIAPQLRSRRAIAS
ncbi:MAG: hypothetical protein ABL901_14045 [Hyphomicrobiaceae bacterium]